jgi:hypothetical protein
MEPYDASMTSPETTTVMTFPDLDSAESALDWIGIDFVEGEGEGEGDGEGETGGWFTGELDEDAAELIVAAIEDGETPLPVLALAQVLRERWNDGAAPRAWRVTFPA